MGCICAQRYGTPTNLVGVDPSNEGRGQFNLENCIQIIDANEFMTLAGERVGEGDEDVGPHRLAHVGQCSSMAGQET